jgi:hypothetical protein
MMAGISGVGLEVEDEGLVVGIDEMTTVSVSKIVGTNVGEEILADEGAITLAARTCPGRIDP